MNERLIELNGPTESKCSVLLLHGHIQQRNEFFNRIYSSKCKTLLQSFALALFTFKIFLYH